jgi:hypothetical protein
VKLVSESLNELYKFEKKCDPLVSLGVGTHALIVNWLNEMHIDNYHINDNYTIKIIGHLDLSSKNLYKLPDYIKFDKVLDSCWSYNNNFTNLKGFPSWVELHFNCSYNNLQSLDGCPEYVGGFFDCSHNNLTSLKGCPKIVIKAFTCNDNKVKFTNEDVLNICKTPLSEIYK